MSLKETSEIIRVFVASPSDVSTERDVAAEAVDELNRSVCVGLGVRLEVVRWESHTYPALGADPQATVLEQIGDDFQVFLGVLWTRFGTPTPRAESGTYEEFQRAMERLKADPSSISVMFYFKEEPVSPAEIDPEQLRLVQEFREQISQQGIYGTFNTEDEFASNVRVHLTRVLFDRPDLRRSAARSRDPTQAAEMAAQVSSEQTRSSALPGGDTTKVRDNEEEQDEDEGDEEEEGLLDLILGSNEKLDEATATLNRMAKSLQDLGEHTNEGSEKLKAIDATKGGSEIKKAKKIVNHLASKLQTVFDRLEADNGLFKEQFPAAIRFMEKALIVSEDFGTDAEDKTRENLAEMRTMQSSIPPSKEAVVKLRETIEGLPRITTGFNRAKSRGKKVLGSIEREFSAADTLTRGVIELIESRLEHESRSM